MDEFRPRLETLERRDTPSTYQEIEPNNLVVTPNVVSIASGNVLTATLEDWLTVQAVLDTTPDRDYFRFTLSAFSAVFFDLDSIETGLSDSLDSVIDVYDATGTVPQGNSDEGYDFDQFIPPTIGVPTATSHDSSLYLELGAGSYLVRVMSFQSASAGSYHLRMLADANFVGTMPVMASRPSAPVSLFLDYDGHNATDDWGTYSAAAFDFTGQASTFSPGEALAARNMWKIVAGVAPFNVNVTTVEPASFSNGQGYRVVISSSPGSLIGQLPTARGAAIVGSFGGLGINTGFVFQNGFSDYQGGVSGRVVAAALEQGNETSHQFGRALGLSHYGGINSQPTGIMQFPDTGLNRSTWSAGLTHSGEPPIVSQNDVASIAATVNGIGYAADDHGDVIATATVLTSSSGTGVIASATDRDMFQFPAQQGNSIIQVSSDIFAGNVDLELRVYNSTGQLLTTVSPNDSLDAGVTIYLPTAGNYFVEVRGNGTAGAIGTYRLDLAFAPVTGPGQVVSNLVNGGAPQRSMVRDLTIRFSRPMTFPNGVAAAFAVTGVSGAATIDIDLSPSTPSQTIAVIRFPNGMAGFGSIADGNYQLTIYSANVLDDGDQQLDGDANTTPGGNYLSSFYRLFGDFDGDRAVAASDFIALRQAFNGSSIIFDFDGDGSVSASDFLQFRIRFGSSI